MTQQESSTSLATSIRITPRNQASPQEASKQGVSVPDSNTKADNGNLRKEATPVAQNVGFDGVPL